MHIDLASLVVDKIHALGPSAAAEYFAVNEVTVIRWKNGTSAISSAACQKVLDEYTAVNLPEVYGQDKKRVLILMPIYRSIGEKSFNTFIRNYSLYGRDQIGLMTRSRTLIWEARNQLVHSALKTDSEQFVFIDDDSVLPCGNGAFLGQLGCDISMPMAGQVALSKLLAAPADKLIVSALVFSRHNEKLHAACSDGFDSEATNAALIQCKSKQSNEYLVQRWVGLAFTRVHRSVFERMIAVCDTELPDIKPSAPGRHYGFFTPSKQDQGEDSAFCARARAIGIDSFVDCGLPIGHLGDKVY